MKHRTFAPAIGALAALFVAAGVPSYASAADPSGIWAKDDGSAKMEVKKCGRGICSKIVWLRDPNDSRGRPLHDARNENTSMRDRPIIGLPLFANMVAIDSSTWQGSVYNPEEGKIYTDVKVTLASRNQIVLKGCKAWLLCGEKYWTRSKLPPTEAEPEPIEVKAPAEPVEPADQRPTGRRRSRSRQQSRRPWTWLRRRPWIWLRRCPWIWLRSLSPSLRPSWRPSESRSPNRRRRSRSPSRLPRSRHRKRQPSRLESRSLRPSKEQRRPQPPSTPWGLGWSPRRQVTPIHCRSPARTSRA